MSELITSANIEEVIEKNIYIEPEISKQVMMIQTNQSIMKVTSVPQLALSILKIFGLLQLPIMTIFQWCDLHKVMNSIL